MTILTGSEARILVESMIDPKMQTQMCGIELTLQSIESLPILRVCGLREHRAKAAGDSEDWF